jgi:RNA polymerase sigma factor (sigma-70 family)
MDTDVGARDAGVLPSFDDFFRSTFEPVARAAALVARDAGVGQELAQEAFFRMYERWSTFESGEHARRFAYRVAINLARSHLRKHLRVTLAGLDPVRDRSQPAETNDAWLSIVSSLAQLSPRQRAAVVLVDYVGMESVEAAEVLGVSAATVRAHLMRGRTALRERIGEE